MSTNVPDAPEVVVKNLIRDNWYPSYTLDVTPDVHHGWVNDENDHPEITVSNPDESPIDGGDTGYSGIAGGGGGPTQTLAGTVEVNVWADRDRMDGLGGQGNPDPNPRQFVHHAKAHVERVIRHLGAGGGSSDLSWLSIMSADRVVEEPDENEPIMFRYRILVGFGRHTHPDDDEAPFP